MSIAPIVVNHNRKSNIQTREPEFDILSLIQALPPAGGQTVPGGTTLPPVPQLNTNPTAFNVPNLATMGLPGTSIPVQRNTLETNAAEQESGLVRKANETRETAAGKRPKGVRKANITELLGMLALVAASGAEAPNVAKGLMQGISQAEQQELEKQAQEQEQEMRLAEIQARGMETEAQMLGRRNADAIQRVDQQNAAQHQAALLTQQQQFQSGENTKELAARQQGIETTVQGKLDVKGVDKDIAKIRAEASTAVGRMRAHGTNLTQYVKMLNEGDTTQRQIALQAMRKLDPFFGDLSDESLMDAARELTPKSQENKADAALKTGRNQREQGLQEVIKNLKIAQTRSANATASVSEETKKYVGKLANATVNQKNASAEASRASAVKSRAEAGGKGPKGVTATAAFNANTSVAKELSAAEAHIKRTKAVIAGVKGRLNAINAGAKSTPKEKEELELVLRETEPELIYYEQLKAGHQDLQREIGEEAGLTLFGIKPENSDPDEIAQIREAQKKLKDGVSPDVVRQVLSNNIRALRAQRKTQGQ